MTDEKPEKMRARAEKNGYSNGTKYGSLLSQVKYSGILPTPTSVQRDHPERVEKLKATGAKTMMSRAAGENRPNSILDAVMFYGMLPTPKAQEARGNASKDRGKFNLKDEVSKMHEHDGASSQLNPLFVEEMMGFPENWTLLPFLNGETKASKPTETQ